MQNEVSYKAHIETAQAVTYLRELAKSLEEGTAYIKHGSNVVALRPAELVEVEIEASEKKQKQRFTLELTWRVPTEAPTDTLHISADEPPMPTSDDDDDDDDDEQSHESPSDTLNRSVFDE